jgi:predicted nucleotidyltransferase
MAPIANLDELLDGGLARVREKVRIEAAYLFGSQLTDQADQDSDIDLAIFSPDVDRLNLVERVHLTSEISLNCDSRLELHLYLARALAETRSTNFAGYIVTRGKRLI